MSDGKRRRYRKIKRREDESTSSTVQKSEMDGLQPKLLLKTKLEKETKDAAETISNDVPLKTIIVNRSEAQSPIVHGISPNITKEQTNSEQVQAPAQLLEPVPKMTRPATVISSTGVINSSVKKLLMKGNTDFLVVGVVGTQGVGKSTIINLLANEDSKYDYYQKVFVEEDNCFPTKLKQHKCSSRSRTESTHMFITSDRMILLDSPPVLCNSYKKDIITNELDDLRNIICFLSVCHLLIVVQDDYMNINFIRLLQFAELMKPTDSKPFLCEYFPHLLLIKNRAKRHDFIPSEKERLDKMIKMIFKDPQRHSISGGQQTNDSQRQRKYRTQEIDRIVNTFLIPDVKGPDDTPYHDRLNKIIGELRTLVSITPRNKMYSGSAELTEAIWFELLTKASQDTQHFFFSTYEDVHRKHLEAASNTKESHENWREC